MFDSIGKVVKAKLDRKLFVRAIESPGDVQDIERVFRSLADVVEKLKVRPTPLLCSCPP